MIRIFYGEDRVGIQKAVERALGKNYEVIEGAGVSTGEMPSVFYGASLFSAERKIVIKDLGEGAGWGELSKYLDTPHAVVIWETKIDKRTAAWKTLSAAKVEMREFRLAEAPEKKIVFDILDTAMTGRGKDAIKMVERIEMTNEPYMFVGLMVSQALKKMEMRGGEREKRVLSELSKLDMDMKTTSISPWVLVKSFLLRASSRS